MGVLLLLAGHERLAARTARSGATDLDLGAVNPQFDALGLGIGEQVLQRAQPDAGAVGDGEAAGCQ